MCMLGGLLEPCVVDLCLDLACGLWFAILAYDEWVCVCLGCFGLVWGSEDGFVKGQSIHLLP